MSMLMNMIKQQIAQQMREAFALTGHEQKSLTTTTLSPPKVFIINSTGWGGILY
jgi:hypothetical protein